MTTSPSISTYEPMVHAEPIRVLFRMSTKLPTRVCAPNVTLGKTRQNSPIVSGTRQNSRIMSGTRQNSPIVFGTLISLSLQGCEWMHADAEAIAHALPEHDVPETDRHRGRDRRTQRAESRTERYEQHSLDADGSAH